MKYETKMICPKCESTNISRKIIGVEYETVCNTCGYFDDSDYFVVEMVRVCPNCGCASVSTEKRLNGNSTCSNCKLYTKTSAFLLVESTSVVNGFYTELGEKPPPTIKFN